MYLHFAVQMLAEDIQNMLVQIKFLLLHYNKNM